MTRVQWSGAISFGLVNVPVKALTAVSRQQIRFHQLHDADGVRIQQKRICPADGEEVAYEHIVKGYEIAPDEYVMISPDELEALDPKASQLIEIEEFVALDEIDPIYFDKPYLLVPDTGGAKPYVLLAKAMRKAKQVALAKVVMRGKEYLVALKPYGNGLTMITMNYASEIVQPDAVEGLPSEDVEVRPREVEMATQLIEALTTTFEPEKHQDTYRDRVQELIEAKAAGERVVVQPTREKESPVIDLMAALEASLKKGLRAGGAQPTTTKKPAPKRASRAKAAQSA
ncbi:MAG: Ku protein [Thermoleophilia bacterium]|nr:Ku protein [Thermoleophilia bacterium]